MSPSTLASSTPERPASTGTTRDVTQPATSEIGGLARRGALWTFVLILFRQGVNIGSTAVLARVISPHDYGLWGMTGTLTAFLFLVADAGLVWPTIQRRTLSEAQLHNLVWLNVTFGVILTGISLLAGPMLGDFYHQPELRAVVAVTGLAFVFRGVGVQPAALMQRQMRFKQISLVEITAAGVSATVAVVCALRGFGIWSLVIMTLTLHIVSATLYVVWSGYRPSRPRRGVGTRSLIGFGGFMAATALPVYVLYNVDNVVVGHTFGTVALAYYARAYFLMTLPTLLATNSLREVMVPSLAAFQGDSKRMGDAYRRAVQLIAFVGFPLTAGLAVAAPEAVRLVYGPRWTPVAPIVVLLAIGGIAFPVMETARWLFIAAGRAREMFLWSSASAVALAASAFVGARWGLHGVAVSCAVCIACVVTIPMLAAAHRAVGLPLCPTLAPLGSLLLTTGLMTAASAGAGLLATTHHLPWPLVLTAKVITGVLCYGVLTALFHRPLPLAPAERLLQFLLRQPAAAST